MNASQGYFQPLSGFNAVLKLHHLTENQLRGGSWCAQHPPAPLGAAQTQLFNTPPCATPRDSLSSLACQEHQTFLQ